MSGSGLELPPEHNLSVPVMFCPTITGETLERFEVLTKETVLHVQARGKGVLPAFNFTPNQELFNLACGPGKKTEIKILITNTCEAPLLFYIKQVFLKEGRSLPMPKSSSLSAPDNDAKQKNKPKKQKKNKVILEYNSLTAELSDCLEHEFFNVTSEVSADPIFRILDINQSINVLAGEDKAITVRFTPPQTAMNIAETQVSVKDREKKGNKSKNVLEKDVDKKNKSPVESDIAETLNTGAKKSIKSEKRGKKKTKPFVRNENRAEAGKRYFATKYIIFFSENTKVKEWVFIGTLKSK